MFNDITYIDAAMVYHAQEVFKSVSITDSTLQDENPFLGIPLNAAINNSK